MTRREELLLQKDGFEKERRDAADAAHNARVNREAAETELREIERAEIKALKGSGGTDG